MHFGPLRVPLPVPEQQPEHLVFMEAGFIDYGRGIQRCPGDLTKAQRRWWQAGQEEARLFAKAVTI